LLITPATLNIPFAARLVSVNGKANFSAGAQCDKPVAEPYSMTAVDLNQGGRPEMLVGYVNAPGVAYFNDGTEGSISQCPSVTVREPSTQWRQAI